LPSSPHCAPTMTVAGTGNQSARSPGVSPSADEGKDGVMDDKRAPDPFRPGEIPEGRPYMKAGRPGTAVLVVALIVFAAVALIIWAVAR